MRFRRVRLILLSALLFPFTEGLPAQTIHVSVRGKSVEGRPVYWDEAAIVLMARDGQLVTFAPREAKAFRQVSAGFRSLSQAALRGELLRDFGASFDVSGTGQFLVVHPAGQRDLWANRFERLYRSMLHYLTVRGFPIASPEFPLVAVVFPSQRQYLDDARQRGNTVTANTLGYYDPVTNRIYMYDVTSHLDRPARWQTNAETIIHEAAHQTAFNVGIHNRLGEDPRWVVEGLGTLFEASGVWDSHNHPQLSDRVNHLQLNAYRRLVPRVDSVELLQRQIASDQLFAQTPIVAYAHAWALTFYLTEREPRKYADYLRRIKARGTLQTYSPEDRLTDFVNAFGQDLRMCDMRLQRFVGGL